MTACAGETGNGVSPQAMADAIHTVLEADRTAYTRLIVNRLSNEEKIIKASEQWKEEKAGLQYIVDNPGQNYYGEETLGGARYYTAVYPDVAVAKACVTCHKDHKDSPKTDFELVDVMGGVVIRIPL
jgi:hypothetical protein